jgi:hypothetical protein
MRVDAVQLEGQEEALLSYIEVNRFVASRTLRTAAGSIHKLAGLHESDSRTPDVADPILHCAVDVCRQRHAARILPIAHGPFYIRWYMTNSQAPEAKRSQPNQTESHQILRKAERALPQPFCG